MTTLIFYLISGFMCATHLNTQPTYEKSMNKALELWQIDQSVQASKIQGSLGLLSAEAELPATTPAWGEESAKAILEKSCATE